MAQFISGLLLLPASLSSRQVLRRPARRPSGLSRGAPAEWRSRGATKARFGSGIR